MKISIVAPIGITAEELSFYQDKFEAAGHKLESHTDLPTDIGLLNERFKDVDIALLANQGIPGEVYKSAENLKILSVAFTGVDHVPVQYCEENGITVCNAAGYSTNAVAELTFGMVIDLFRHICNGHKQTTEGNDRQGFLGTELFGKTFGVIGAGAIGLRVAEIAKAFGCRVLAYSRTKKDIHGVEFVELDELLQNSDIVSLHVPLMEGTNQLINAEKLALMKNDAVLINTARGPVVDYSALKYSLINKGIAGAALDVYEYEPPLKKDHIMLDAPNCLLLPHVAYATKEAIAIRTKIVMENIFAWLNKQPVNVIV